MFTKPTLLALASGALRLWFTYAVWKRFGWLVTLHTVVAGLLLGPGPIKANTLAIPPVRAPWPRPA